MNKAESIISLVTKPWNNCHLWRILGGDCTRARMYCEASITGYHLGGSQPHQVVIVILVEANFYQPIASLTPGMGAS